MLKRLFTVALLWTILIIPGMTGYAFAWPMPDTGQTECYNASTEIPCPSPGEPFYGQDAQYQIPPRSYTKLGQGGVELADDAAHVDNGGQWRMTRDNVTGLIWEIKTNANKDATYTWSNAQSVFIAGLNSASFGGFNDWRLPAIKELTSLVNSGPSSPAIDTAWFPHILSAYWSSSTFVPGTTYAWHVHFGNGYVGDLSKTSVYVKAVAVRGGFATASLVDNGDGTVTDPSTGLMWQKATAPETKTWQNALAYCEDLTLAGYSDWRLPNRNELQSLVDYSRSGPAIDPLLAPTTASSLYWSSTTYADNTFIPTRTKVNAWHVYFHAGYVSMDFKAYEYSVRAVRSGQSGASGSLVITIEPAAARDAGAQWRRVGTTTWRNSGDTESYAPVGERIVEFKDIDGWAKPDKISLTVNNGETAEATGTYQRITYEVTIAANPQAGGEITGSGLFPHGTEVTVSATTNEGYIFQNWTEGAIEVSINPDYAFTITASRNLVANFYLYGDVNLSGRIDLADSVLLLLYAAGMTDLTDLQKMLGNLTGHTNDDSVGIVDAIKILRFQAGESWIPPE